METEGGGLWVFYRCPDAIPKEKLHKMAKLDGCDKGGGQYVFIHIDGVQLIGVRWVGICISDDGLIVN